MAFGRVEASLYQVFAQRMQGDLAYPRILVLSKLTPTGGDAPDDMGAIIINFTETYADLFGIFHGNAISLEAPMRDFADLYEVVRNEDTVWFQWEHDDATGALTSWQLGMGREPTGELVRELTRAGRPGTVVRTLPDPK